MIKIKKKIDNGVTEWTMQGHAATTDICNGFSFLICVFTEMLKHEVSDLKYVFERRTEKVVYEDGVETETKLINGNEINFISYSGRPSSEAFFEKGIEMLVENEPESVAEVIKDTSERR